MQLSLTFAISFIGGLLMRSLAQAIPSRIVQQEQYWLMQQLGLNHHYQFENSLFQYKKLAKFDRLFCVCFLICFVITAYVLVQPYKTLSLIGFVFFIYILILLSIIDITSRLLPDSLTLSLVWIGLTLQLSPITQTIGINSAVVGAIFGYGILWIPGQIFLLVRKQAGVGHGDMKLLAAIGTWLGWQSLLPVLLIASLWTVASQAPAFILQTIQPRQQLAFGPALVFACLLLLPLYLPI
jgi:prepilin signal peptidase PulO-like enzyme (type II secretory pathway)